MNATQAVVAGDARPRAASVRIMLFDVDGVLTDGGIYFSEQAPSGTGQKAGVGESIKRFNTLDGHGLKLLQKAGITPVIITGRDSVVLRARLQALGIAHAHFGTEDKRPAAEQSLKVLGCDWHEAAAMGDDWPDLPVMRRCALAVAPHEAPEIVTRQANYGCRSPAGAGAAREACELVMRAQGTLDAALAAWLK